jgi:transcription initiation factor IIE alpha subunit
MRQPEYFKIIDEKYPKIRKELARAVGIERKNNLYIGFTLKCKKCKTHFGIESECICVITCPYCGEYVEG